MSSQKNNKIIGRLLRICSSKNVQSRVIQEAHKQSLLRSVLDDKIYFNFEEYEEIELADPLVTDWTTVYRNNTWHPKTSLAIKQKRDTAIICGNLHLIGETGMVRSLRRDGYDVEHVNSTL